MRSQCMHITIHIFLKYIVLGIPNLLEHKYVFIFSISDNAGGTFQSMCEFPLDSSVVWGYSTMLNSLCDVDMSTVPFDRQTCYFHYGVLNSDTRTVVIDAHQPYIRRFLPKLYWTTSILFIHKTRCFCGPTAEFQAKYQEILRYQRIALPFTAILLWVLLAYVYFHQLW